MEPHQVLFESAAEVLETMFFATVADSGTTCAEAPEISARLSFRGKPSGSFGVRIPLPTGRKIAATFLGIEEEEIAPSQITDVVCELANMVCGSVLSRLENKTGFELFHPELDSPEAAGNQDASATTCSLELDEGPLQVWVKLDPVP